MVGEGNLHFSQESLKVFFLFMTQMFQWKEASQTKKSICTVLQTQLSDETFIGLGRLTEYARRTKVLSVL